MQNILGMQVLHGCRNLQCCQSNHVQVWGTCEGVAAGAEPTPDHSILQADRQRQLAKHAHRMTEKAHVKLESRNWGLVAKCMCWEAAATGLPLLMMSHDLCQQQVHTITGIIAPPGRHAFNSRKLNV